MTGMRRRTALGFLAGTALAGRRADAASDTYPDRPLRVLVPFSAGGAVDIVARTVMAEAGPRLGQPVVVEARPGANGNIAPAAVAKAPPDGYTLLIGANGLATNPSLFDNLTFDALSDLAPIALVGFSPMILVLGLAFPAGNVADLVAMAKADPGRLTFASAGHGTSGHLAAEIFKQIAGIEALHVPYKGGAQAIVDLIAGRVGFMFLDPVQALPQIGNRQLRAIAVSAAERLDLLPDVPTMAQAGYPGADATVWWGFLAPARTPADIIARLNGEITRALQTAAVRTRLQGLGVVIRGGSPEAFGDFLRSETARWAQIIRKGNIRPE